MQNYPEWIEKVGNEWWLTESDRENLKISYRLKDIVFSERSDLQHVMILDTYDFGRMLVLDGVVQTTSIDGHIYNEMISHVPISLHSDPQKVLIIGGGDCGAAREAARHPEVKQIDMVEIDELVVTASKKHLQEVSGNLSDPRVRFIFDDGIKFVQEKEKEYDVIIIDSSDPVGPAKQLFERSFYENLHSSLKDGGIMSCQSQSPIFHQDALAETYRHISGLFTHSGVYTAVVPTYPGGLWSFTIGSKQQPLKPAREVDSSLGTKYFNGDILERCFVLPEFMKDLLK